MKYKKIIITIFVLSFLIPSSVSADSFTIPWNATTTTGTVLTLPAKVNGIRPIPYAPYFIATSTTSSVFPYASTTAITSSGSAYFATAGGNVGIGSTTPNNKLDINGNFYASGSGFFGGAITATSSLTFSNFTGILSSNGTSGVSARTLTGTTNQITITNGDGTAGNPTFSLPSTLSFTNATSTNFFASRLTANTFSAGQTASTTIDAGGNLATAGTLNVTGATTLATSLTGPLQAIAGAVSASSTLSQFYGGTGFSTYTTGDILYSNSTNSLARLGIGTAGYVLGSSGGLPAWLATSTIGIQGRGNGASTQIAYFSDANTITSSSNYTFNSTTNLLTLTGNASTTQIGSTGSAYFATAGGNVGIGTTTPWGLLSVNPNGIGSGPEFVVGSSTATHFVINNQGNVGIGTTTPSSLLSVHGNSYVSGSSFFGGAITGTSTLAIQSTTATSTFSTGGLTVGTSQFVVQQTSGNVGIGTTGPDANLSVVSNSGTKRGVTVKSASGQTANLLEFINSSNAVTSVVTPTGQIGLGTTTPVGLFNIENGSPDTELLRLSRSGQAALRIINYNGSIGTFQLQSATGDFSSFSNLMSFNPNTGNVGIGTTTPSNLLSVYSATAATVGFTGGGTKDVWSMGYDVTNNRFAIASSSSITSNVRMVIDNQGNVGIGTTSPNSLFQVEMPSTSGTAILVSGGGGNSIGRLGGSGSNFTVYTASGSQLLFGNGSTEKMRLGNTGNVGIGTTTPLSKLAVSGGASVGADYNIAAPTNGMIIQGNVGIGTANPGARLVVENAGAVAININDSSNGNVPTINFQQAGVTKANIEGGAGLGNRLDFGVGSASRLMTLLTTGVSIGRSYAGTTPPVDGLIIEGNVGIGTTSPAHLLEVAGEAYFGKDSTLSYNTVFRGGGGSGQGPYLTFRRGGVDKGYLGTDAALNNNNSDDMSLIGYGATSKLLFFTGGTNQRMVIDSAGNVGIGTTTPISKLHVDSGSTATTTSTFGNIGSVNSKACFNTKNTSGADISFYFIGTTMIVENNLCR